MDNDGYITREEMYDIVGAIYEMLGSAKQPGEGAQQAADATSDEAPNVRVDRIFELLDSVSIAHGANGALPLQRQQTTLSTIREIQTLTNYSTTYNTII